MSDNVISAEIYKSLVIAGVNSCGAYVVARELIGRLIRILHTFNLIDVPNHRSSHIVPTPRGGGSILVLVILLGSLVSLPFCVADEVSNKHHFLFLLVSLCVGLVGLIDDYRGLSARLRFLLQCVCAGLVIYSYGGFSSFALPIVGSITLPTWLGYMITFLWIVGLTNAYNFMDGIDGIAGIQGVVGGISWCLIGMITGNMFLVAFGALIFGSCGGFLTHNWAPARIFMGDVGSAFLGFLFATTPLFLDEIRYGAVRFWLGFFVVCPFVIDTGITFSRRLLRGANVFSAHREHFYQKLIIGGRSHSDVALLYGVMGGMCAAVAVSLVFL